MTDFALQTDKPLYPDSLWNRPLNRRHGGRLLIVGGQKRAFSQCQTIYQLAIAAGAGECGLALPDALKKIISPIGMGHFLPSSPSGSLGKAALGELLELARDYDAMVIAGNLTNNSETAVLVESLLNQLTMPIVAGEEALQIMRFNPLKLIRRPKTLLVFGTEPLFKLAGALNIPVSIRPGESLASKLELANQLAARSESDFLLSDGHLIIPGNKAVVTPASEVQPEAAISVAATFWIQNRHQSTQGLATAAFVLATAYRTAGRPSTVAGLANAISKVLNRF